MSQFTKEKLAFAVALLAILFTLSPLIPSVGPKGFKLVGIHIQIRHLYFFMSAALALSVYTYGIQFITERRLRGTTWCGHFFYAIAIVAPLLFGALYLAVTASILVGHLLESPTAALVLQLLAGSASSVLSLYLASRLWRALATKERRSALLGYEELEVAFLQRAEQLFQAGHYDLATVESFRAVETAVRKYGFRVGLATKPRWTSEVARGLLPAELRNLFDELRRVRNLAAHAIEPTSRDDAKAAISAASRLLAWFSEEADA